MTEEFEVALRLIRHLNNTFPGTQSLIVGGAVRDHILNRPCHDVDIATNVPLELLAQHFNVRDITKTTVAAQPVSVISWEDEVFEIAAFRSDSQSVGGRKNNVSTIVSTFEEDSARRDITINAIGMNARREIIDPQGGLSDIHNRVIRCVGNPSTRFEEDATRVLRVLRFASKFNFDIDPITAVSIISDKNRLCNREEISPESISKELVKAASGSGQEFRTFIELLQSFGILQDILPELSALEGFTHDPLHHPEGDSTVIGHILECLSVNTRKNPVVNLAILFHDLGKAVTRGVNKRGFSSYHGHECAGVPIVKRIFERLRFNDLSSHDKDGILFTVEKHMLLHSLDKLKIATLCKTVNHPHWELLKWVARADEASRGPDLFNKEDFENKISHAEFAVTNIAPHGNELRKKVKQFIDGNKIQEWFPQVKEDLTQLRGILDDVISFVLENLQRNVEPSEQEVKEQVAKHFNK